MKFLYIFLMVLVAWESFAEPVVHLKKENCLFVQTSVPERGIVCSNLDRAERLSKMMEDVQEHKCSWGPKVFVGRYQGVPMFIAAAPVGSGSGLVFTELYAQGAKYIIRYGSDDIKSPAAYEYKTVKVVDEADHLYGYAFASGVDWKDCGKSIQASEKLIQALEDEASARGLNIERRLCHHLENYHAMRFPKSYSKERQKVMDRYVPPQSDKKISIDMETAVLFQTAKDFDQHAVSVLQTVNKEKGQNPYAGKNREEALQMEKVFAEYVLGALLRL